MKLFFFLFLPLLSMANIFNLENKSLLRGIEQIRTADNIRPSLTYNAGKIIVRFNVYSPQGFHFIELHILALDSKTLQVSVSNLDDGYLFSQKISEYLKWISAPEKFILLAEKNELKFLFNQDHVSDRDLFFILNELFHLLPNFANSNKLIKDKPTINW